jgi:hypothetical protein
MFWKKKRERRELQQGNRGRESKEKITIFRWSM